MLPHTELLQSNKSIVPNCYLLCFLGTKYRIIMQHFLNLYYIICLCLFWVIEHIPFHVLSIINFYGTFSLGFCSIFKDPESHKWRFALSIFIHCRTSFVNFQLLFVYDWANSDKFFSFLLEGEIEIITKVLQKCGNIHFNELWDGQFKMVFHTS